MNKGIIREVEFFGDYFLDFYRKQTYKVRKKIDWTIGLLQYLEKIPEKYLKHIEGTDLYEIRVSFGRNIFRIFCFFERERLVIVLNGFQKKSQKTSRVEIERALRIKEDYYGRKD